VRPPDKLLFIGLFWSPRKIQLAARYGTKRELRNSTRGVSVDSVRGLFSGAGTMPGSPRARL